LYFLTQPSFNLFFKKIFQNWRRAHKKRVLFKLGSTLVGEIDVIEERNNNADDNDVNETTVADDADVDNEIANPTLLRSTASSPTPSTSSSNSGAENRASVYDEILHDEDWRRAASRASP